MNKFKDDNKILISSEEDFFTEGADAESDKKILFNNDEDLDDSNKDIDFLNKKSSKKTSKKINSIDKKDFFLEEDDLLDNEDIFDKEEEESELLEKSITSGKSSFDELNKYDLLTKKEEQDLGSIINDNFNEVVKFLCMTRILGKCVNQWKVEITNSSYHNLSKIIDIDILSLNDKNMAGSANFQTLSAIMDSIDKFLHKYRIFHKKYKSEIKELAMDKICFDDIINVFNLIPIQKNKIYEIVRAISNLVYSTNQRFYEALQKSRSNKKKKHVGYDAIIDAVEKELGFSFKSVLQFLQKMNYSLFRGNMAKNKMIVSNRRLVAFAARSFKDKDLKYFDLLQFGYLGLLQSLPRFKFNLNHRFSTYSIWWIRQFISRKMLKSKLVVLPSHLQDTCNKFKKYRNMIQNTGQEMSDQEICDQAGLDYSIVKKALRESKSSCSSDKYIGDGNQTVLLEEVVPDKLNVKDLRDVYSEDHDSKTAAYAFSRVSSSTENRFRIRSLSHEDAKSWVFRKAHHENRRKLSGVPNKHNKHILLNERFNQDKNNMRSDIQEIVSIKKNMLPKNISIKNPKSKMYSNLENQNNKVRTILKNKSVNVENKKKMIKEN